MAKKKIKKEEVEELRKENSMLYEKVGRMQEIVDKYRKISDVTARIVNVMIEENVTFLESMQVMGGVMQFLCSRIADNRILEAKKREEETKDISE